MGPPSSRDCMGLYQGHNGDELLTIHEGFHDVMGEPPQMVGLQWEIALRWMMIWG